MRRSPNHMLDERPHIVACVRLRACSAAALREKVKARMMPTVVEAKKTWSDPPVDEKEVDEWGEVEDEEY